MKRKLRKSINIFLLIVAIVLALIITGADEMPIAMLLALTAVELMDLFVLVKYGDFSYLLEEGHEVN